MLPAGTDKSGGDARSKGNSRASMSGTNVSSGPSHGSNRGSGSSRGDVSELFKRSSPSKSQVRRSKKDDDYLPPTKAPKEMDDALLRAAESLPKDYQNCDFEVPGEGKFTVPYIPYYCFMRDREPVSSARNQFQQRHDFNVPLCFLSSCLHTPHLLSIISSRCS